MANISWFCGLIWKIIVSAESSWILVKNFFVAQMVPEIYTKKTSLKRRGFYYGGVNCSWNDLQKYWDSQNWTNFHYTLEIVKFTRMNLKWKLFECDYVSYYLSGQKNQVPETHFMMEILIFRCLNFFWPDRWLGPMKYRKILYKRFALPWNWKIGYQRFAYYSMKYILVNCTVHSDACSNGYKKEKVKSVPCPKSEIGFHI